MFMTNTDYTKVPKGSHVIGIKIFSSHDQAAEYILAYIRTRENLSPNLRSTLLERARKTKTDYRHESDYAIGEVVLSRLFGSDPQAEVPFLKSVYGQLGIWVPSPRDNPDELKVYDENIIKETGKLLKSLTDKNLEEIVGAHLSRKSQPNQKSESRLNIYSRDSEK